MVYFELNKYEYIKNRQQITISQTKKNNKDDIIEPILQCHPCCFI